MQSTFTSEQAAFVTTIFRLILYQFKIQWIGENAEKKKTILPQTIAQTLIYTNKRETELGGLIRLFN